MKYTVLVGALVAAASIAAPASAATNLVTNGGFETTTLTTSTQIKANDSTVVSGWTNAATTGYTGAGYNFLLKSGAAASTGFTSLGGNLDYLYGQNTATTAANYSANGFVSTSPSGGNFLLLDGDVNFRGAVSQTINGLVAGQAYTLTFDWAGISWGGYTGATTERFDVSLGTVTQSTNTVSLPSKGFSGWQSATMNFVARGSSQTLSFLANGTPVGQPPSLLLDNVSMTAAVPEPATWAMMLVGFGMVGAASRYRRRKVAVAA